MSTTLGRRLQDARRDAELTAAQLAEVVGITPAYLSRLENDKAEPSRTLLLALEHVLVVSETWLVTGSGPRSPTAGRGASYETPDRLARHVRMVTDIHTSGSEEAIDKLEFALLLLSPEKKERATGTDGEPGPSRRRR